MVQANMTSNNCVTAYVASFETQDDHLDLVNVNLLLVIFKHLFSAYT